MRILIIAYYFPPETYATMASLRPYSWAKYWSEEGHEITILTTAKNRDTHQLNLDNNVQICEVPYLSFQTKKSTQSNLYTKKQSKIEHLRKFFLYLQKHLGGGTLFYGSNLWIFSAFQKVLQLHCQKPFDVVVSTYSPPAVHIVASLLKKKFNVFWVADYRDLWFGNTYISVKFPFYNLEKQLETYFVKSADLIATVSEPLKIQLSQRFKQPICVIENGFDLAEIPSDKKFFPLDNKIRLAYTGSVYVGRQDPSSLFKAIASLGKEKARLEILFYTFETNYISNLVGQYGLQEVVKLSQFVPREECLRIQNSVDALIFLDWNDPTSEGILTGKIFEYMYSDKPVLAIGSERGTIATRLIEEAKIGVSLGNSSEKIADFLTKMLQGINFSYNPDRSVLQRYTREGLAKKMLAEIQKYCSKKG